MLNFEKIPFNELHVVVDLGTTTLNGNTKRQTIYRGASKLQHLLTFVDQLKLSGVELCIR